MPPEIEQRPSGKDKLSFLFRSEVASQPGSLKPLLLFLAWIPFLSRRHPFSFDRCLIKVSKDLVKANLDLSLSFWAFLVSDLTFYSD